MATPAVRRLAVEKGVDLADVTATGKGGRVIKEDIFNYLEQKGGTCTIYIRTLYMYMYMYNSISMGDSIRPAICVTKTCTCTCMHKTPTLLVTPVQLMRPGIGRNTSCALGDCFTA